MKKTLTSAVFLTATLLSPFSIAAEAISIGDVFSEGKLEANFRYRYEGVDQNGFSENAKGSTLRARVGFTSATFNGLGFQAELDGLYYIGADDFNNTRNGHTTYPVIADPDGTDINQLFLSYKNGENQFKLGRQRINLDNQRFVGGVGWRQNEQTYDAFTVVSKSVPDSTIVYAYVDNISRIFGPDAGIPGPDIEANTHIINVNYKTDSTGSLSVYGYFMDLDDAPGASNQTLGLRYSRTMKVGEVVFPLNIEFASQNDHGDNPTDYSANYYLFETGAKFEGFSTTIGWEVLEADSSAGVAFITPAATLHKFQGWADKFLATPTTGIDDKYVGFHVKLAGTALNLVYHQFDAELGNADYGSELDFSAGRKISDNISILLKVARYSAETHSSDTNKFWIMLSANI